MEKLINIVKDSKTRIVVSLMMVLVLAFIVAIDNEFLTWATLGIVYLVAFYESCKLFDIHDTKLYAIAILLWIVCFFYPQPLMFAILTILIITAAMLQKNRMDFKILLPFLYPTMPMVILLTQYQYFGMLPIIWLIIIAASCDIGAYFIGKAIGKTKFSSISPNKTKEGVYGGIIIGTLSGTIYGMSFEASDIYSFFLTLAISFGAAIGGVYGDLFESYLKRRANVKDSGTIFPGHGGMLDRIDSYLFGTVVMFAFFEGVIH